MVGSWSVRARFMVGVRGEGEGHGERSVDVSVNIARAGRE